jgi:hypothetical protein
MSLLTSPQGRPDSVFALLRLLRVLEKDLMVEDIRRWLVVEAGEDNSTGLEQIKAVVACSESLGLVTSGRGKPVSLTDAGRGLTSYPAFLDEVHARLRDDVGGNRELLSAIAYLAAAADLDPPPSMLVGSRATFVDWIRARHEEIGYPVFNTTKLLPWMSWCSELGLGFFPSRRGAPGTFLLLPSIRLERELRTIAVGRVELSAGDLASGLASSMPYLAGGEESLWGRARRALRAPETGRAGRTLTEALRALADRGVVQLLEAGGDAKGALNLFLDRRDPGAIRGIRLLSLEGGQA